MEAMKKAKVKLDMKRDVVMVFGKKQALVTTSKGHYRVPLLGKTNCEERRRRNHQEFVRMENDMNDELTNFLI